MEPDDRGPRKSLDELLEVVRTRGSAIRRRRRTRRLTALAVGVPVVTVVIVAVVLPQLTGGRPTRINVVDSPPPSPSVAPAASPSPGASPSTTPEGVPTKSPSPIASSQLSCSTGTPAQGPGAAVASLGDVSARLSWARQGDPGSSYMVAARIKLTRAGVTLLDTAVTAPSPVGESSTEWWAKGWETLSPVCVEVPAYGLPSVHLTGYALGMTCCGAVRSYYPRADGTYGTLDRSLGRGEGTFELAGGRVVLVASDPAFHSRFDCAACGLGPLQVWALDDGRSVDVTREFPDRIAAEAAGWWDLIKSRDPAPLGIVAPWVADECQLGRKASAYAALDDLNAAGKLRFPDQGAPAPWPEGSEYISALKSFLTTEGYCR